VGRSEAVTELASIVLPPTMPAFQPSPSSASITVIAVPSDRSRTTPETPAAISSIAPVAATIPLPARSASQPVSGDGANMHKTWTPITTPTNPRP
jgi:hypothetical protein